MTTYDPSYWCICGHTNKRHRVRVEVPSGWMPPDEIELIDASVYDTKWFGWGSCMVCDCAEFRRAIAASRAYRAGRRKVAS